MKKILITGITGQDGLFLTEKYLNENENHFVYGISRSNDLNLFYKKLNTLHVKSVENLKILNIDLNNRNQVFDLLKKINPQAVYNFSGPSSVYQSLDNKEGSISTIKNIFDNLTESLIKLENFCNFFQASSSEMFENVSNNAIDENTRMVPNSPYAIGKHENHKTVLKLSKEFNWNIVSGIMFNHESEFREDDYLIKKIINSADKISKKQMSSFQLGSPDYVRDWSFAGDVINAAFTLIKNNSKGSYVIGSGKGSKILDIVEIVFDSFNLNWENYLEINEDLLRKGDAKVKVSNPAKIKQDIGWETSMNFDELIYRCIG
jgi:GDPmannose 4,6-dehydratase